MLASQITLGCAWRTGQAHTRSAVIIPASWASGASSQAGGPACMSAPAGPNAKTGAGPWAAWEKAGMEGRVVPGSAAEAACGAPPLPAQQQL